MSYHTETEFNTHNVSGFLCSRVSIPKTSTARFYKRRTTNTALCPATSTLHTGMATYDKDALTAIANASYAQLERIAREGKMHDRDTSNKLICLRREIPGVDCATVLSRFVAENLLKAQAFVNLREKRKFLRLFTAILEMGIARRWLFEAYARNRFSSSSDTTEGITVYTTRSRIRRIGRIKKYRLNLDSTADLQFPLMDRTVRIYTSPDDFVDSCNNRIPHSFRQE